MRISSIMRPTILNLRLLGTLIFLLSNPVGPAFAKTFILSDFDNTFIESRREYGGTFHPLIRVFRVHTRWTPLDQEFIGPEEIDLSPHDFQRVSKHLAQASNKPGVSKKVITLDNGLKFQPSYYYLRNPDSYLRFGATSNFENSRSLIDDLQATGMTNWKGPFFSFVQEFLKTPDGAKSIGIITARGHSRSAWHDFFSYLKELGEIQFLPELHHFHSVGVNGHYDRYAPIDDIPGRKIGILKDYALALAKMPLTEQDERLSPDGTSVERLHFLVFADDNPDTLEKALELFQSMTRRRSVPVKFAIFNSGLKSQVRATRRPRFLVIKRDGSIRPLKSDEFNVPKASELSGDCETVF